MTDPIKSLEQVLAEIRAVKKYARPLRYASPLLGPSDRDLARRGQGYAPEEGGVSVDGVYFAGGELLPPHVAAEVPEDQLVTNRKAALRAFASPSALPQKVDDGEEVGTYQHLQVGGGPRDVPLPVPQANPRNPRDRELPGSPEEGRANLPEDLREDVDDPDASRMSRIAANKVVTLFNELPPDEDFVAGAMLGKAKRGWYKNTATALIELFGDDAPRFAALLAATSPVKAVADNLRNALRVWIHFQKLPTRIRENPKALGEELERLFAETGEMKDRGQKERQYHLEFPGGEYFLDTEIPNMIRALTAEDPSQLGTLSGPKVDSFRGNLLGQLALVTNDTWQAAFSGIPQNVIAGDTGQDMIGTKSGRSPEYMALSAKTRRAAHILNRDHLAPGEPEWQPAEVQETVWSTIRGLAALAGMSRRSGGSPLSVAEGLGALTHEWISNNADFLTLLSNDRVARRNIEELGLGPALSRVRRLIEARSKAEGLPTLTGSALEGVPAEYHDAARRVGGRAFIAGKGYTSHTAKYARRPVKKSRGNNMPSARIATKAAGRKAHAPPGHKEFLAGHVPDLFSLFSTILSSENVRHIAPLRLPDEEKEVGKLKFAAGEDDELHEAQIEADRVEEEADERFHDGTFDKEIKQRDEDAQARVRRLRGINPERRHEYAKDRGAGEDDELSEAEERMARTHNTLARDYDDPKLLGHSHLTQAARESDKRNAHRHANLADRIRGNRPARFEKGDFDEDEVSEAENAARRRAEVEDYMDRLVSGDTDGWVRQADKQNIDPGSADRRPGRFQFRRRYAAEGDSALVATSQNTESDLSFDQAVQRANSGDQKVFKQSLHQFVQQQGVKGQLHNAVGDWEDGAEHSVLGTFDPTTDRDTLRYLAAWSGLMGNQRAALMFHPHGDGLDSVYTVQVPDTNMGKVRKALSAAGVPFRTLVPGKNGTRVIIYDEKRRLRDNVAKFAGGYRAGVRESIGSGEYVGGGSRTEARSKYRKIIAEYEASRGRGRRPV